MHGPCRHGEEFPQKIPYGFFHILNLPITGKLTDNVNVPTLAQLFQTTRVQKPENVVSSEKYLQQTVYLPQVIAEDAGRAAVYRTKSCAPVRCAMDISVIKSSALRDDAFGWS
jgi:hypothetical protein